MRWRSGAVMAVVVASALSGCAITTTVTAGPPAHRTGHPDGPVAAVPFALYTHCGIHELAYQGRYYVRAGVPLDDGQGNPPAGWGNPYQRGSLTIHATTAVFSDATGHHETFVLRPGATAFEAVCS